ncbi:DUF3782 domain-containing protein [Candidatus Magnetomoraceae bacterium gMMP-15]
METQTIEQGFQKVWLMFQETDKKFQELARRFKETNRQTDKQIKKTDKNIRRLERLFEGQWGKLMESLAEGSVLQLFQKRGINVFEIHQRCKKHFNGKTMEIDLLLVDDAELVVVEVKTTLKAHHVERFLKRLKEFPEFFTGYKDKRIYGAVAALRTEQGSEGYSQNEGLFVIKIGGEGMTKILNEKDFYPINFGKKIN